MEADRPAEIRPLRRTNLSDKHEARKRDDNPEPLVESPDSPLPESAPKDEPANPPSNPPQTPGDPVGPGK